MEDSRASTSFQRLSRTFKTLLESKEADITAIPVVRSEHFPTGRSGDIPVSVQELAYGRKTARMGASAKPLDREMNYYLQVKKFFGPEKTGDLLKGCTLISCKGKVQKIKAWLENQCILSEDQKKKLAQKKENSPVEAPQASTSNNPPQQV
ncbi:hypothetical protein O181_050128 [Austropuccinia psidii MF-1]|uniref:Uncharacterized protein n=1 Tax=Austropuccinia psidii MF-1 TaxID=1389203 RepID=A0A9Q3HM31_9BASI|nr:hypothetical protein [Austropuccinia psidii MF-1]